MSQASRNCCYIICQSQTNKKQFHTVTEFHISLCSLLTGPWAMCCVCVCACCVSYSAFCSVVVLGLAGGTGLGVRSDTSQPNTENVLPAPSNIFSNTLHSFLTRTTTSAHTTRSPFRLFLPRAAPQLVHKRSIVPLGFFFGFLYLCINFFTMHLVAACASSG